MTAGLAEIVRLDMQMALRARECPGTRATLMIRRASIPYRRPVSNVLGTTTMIAVRLPLGASSQLPRSGRIGTAPTSIRSQRSTGSFQDSRSFLRRGNCKIRRRRRRTTSRQKAVTLLRPRWCSLGPLRIAVRAPGDIAMFRNRRDRPRAPFAWWRPRSERTAVASQGESRFQLGGGVLIELSFNGA